MFQFLIQCLRLFGLGAGLLIYARIKILKADKVTLPGLKHPIYFRPGSSDIHTFREIFLRREYAIQIPEENIPKTIIDAGANIGFTTLFFLLRFPNSQIISLEPNAENFELLKKNTAGYPNILPMQAALWNKKGVLNVIDEGYGVRGFVVGEGSLKNADNVPSTTLMELISQNNISSIDILKIDIEGSEKEVFSSDTDQWLPLTKRIIIELHDRMKSGCSKSVFNAVGQYNFEFSIKGENIVFINRD